MDTYSIVHRHMVALVDILEATSRRDDRTEALERYARYCAKEIAASDSVDTTDIKYPRLYVVKDLWDRVVLSVVAHSYDEEKEVYTRATNLPLYRTTVAVFEEEYRSDETTETQVPSWVLVWEKKFRGRVSAVPLD